MYICIFVWQYKKLLIECFAGRKVKRADMDKKQFVKIVGAPGRFTAQDRGWLHAVQAKYPYSSVVNVLTLLADKAFRFDTHEQLRVAALSMCDSNALDAMLDRTTSVTEEPSFDVLNELNTFQEVSFKTAPKSVILSNFLQMGPSPEPENEPVPEPQPSADDKKSIRADASLGTETLAVILEKQGKYDRALAIYKNLLAQNPEKSSTFAPRIARLETLINNK